MKTIFLIGGGTGGHLFSAIALGQELKERGYNIHLITDTRCKKYLTNSNYDFNTHILNLDSLSSKGLKKFWCYIKLALACIKSLKFIRQYSPCTLVAFGGYTTIPTLVAGIFFRIPIILHEQNSFLGHANYVFSRYAQFIAITFAKTINLDDRYKQKIIITGNPVRKELRSLPKRKFNSKPFQLIVTGGSQGAKIFSNLVPNAIKLLVTHHPNFKIKIIHQAAFKDVRRLKKFILN